jgi:tetratricopeptide (TPR) repeat protein
MPVRTAAAVLAVLAAVAAPPRHPQLLTSPAHDSIGIGSEPAPLIVPGAPQPPPADTLAPRTPRAFAERQYAIGQAMERDGNPGAASIAYANAARADSTLRGPAGRLGHLYLESGRAKLAVPMLKRELRRAPGDADAERDLALSLGALGRRPDAIARLTQLTKRAPGDDRNWYALGVTYAGAGRMREAKAPLERAVALAPERAVEHRDLGVALAALGEAEGARAEYRRALSIDARDAAAWLDLANLEARTSRPDSAIAAYRRAQQLEPEDAATWEGERLLLERANRRDEIADLYLRWVTAIPNDDDLRLRAVRHLATIDRRDRALEIGRDGVRYDAKSPDKHLILGLALAAYGSTREALAELRTAQLLYPAGAADRARVRQLVASMRQSAPDSLRGLFAADSLAHPAP